MSGATGAIIGASAAVGAGASVYGANKAAKSTDKASAAANAEQARQFDLVRGDTAKLRGLGDSAIDRINKLYGYTPPEEALSYEDWLAENPSVVSSAPFSGSLGAGRAVFDSAMGASSRAAYQNYLNNFQPTTVATGPDMSAFFESPDYQFRLSETQKAIDRMGSARGSYDSGGTYKAGARYASNLASGEFASFYDRLAQQAGLGVTGIGTSAAAGSNAANNIGANLVNAGNSRASAYMSSAQGVNNAVQGGLQNWALQKYLGQGALSDGAGTWV